MLASTIDNVFYLFKDIIPKLHYALFTFGKRVSESPQWGNKRKQKAGYMRGQVGIMP